MYSDKHAIRLNLDLCHIAIATYIKISKTSILGAVSDGYERAVVKSPI